MKVEQPHTPHELSAGPPDPGDRTPRDRTPCDRTGVDADAMKQVAARSGRLTHDVEPNARATELPDYCTLPLRDATWCAAQLGMTRQHWYRYWKRFESLRNGCRLIKIDPASQRGRRKWFEGAVLHHIENECGL